MRVGFVPDWVVLDELLATLHRAAASTRTIEREELQRWGVSLSTDPDPQSQPSDLLRDFVFGGMTPSSPPVDDDPDPAVVSSRTAGTSTGRMGSTTISYTTSSSNSDDSALRTYDAWRFVAATQRAPANTSYEVEYIMADMT